MDMLTNLSLFSGAGGLDLGARLAGGIRTVCYVEYEKYAQGVLMSRMRDGSLDPAPIWDNVQTFDGKPLRGRVDIISGGFPCQDVSVAGKKKGIKEGTRSGLWSEFARLIGEVRPRFILVENVRGLVRRGLARVLKDLAQAGYDAEWEVISAADVGAPHKRERIWIVAYPDKQGLERKEERKEEGVRCRPERCCRRKGVSKENLENTRRELRSGSVEQGAVRAENQRRDANKLKRPSEMGDTEKWWEQGEQPFGPKAWGPGGASWWSTEPNVGRVANGVAFRVDRLRCCGNGVVPQQSLPAWERIKEIAAQ